MNIPELETKNLILKEFKKEDLNRLAEITSDYEVVKYFPGKKPWPKERAMKELQGIIGHWKQIGYGRWALVFKEDNILIGWCGLEYLKELGETEIGFLLDKRYWNRGLATEAAKESVKYAFQEVKLEKLIALAFPENTASTRVMEKIGMIYDETIFLWNHNLVKYFITRSHWKSL
jgi:RimJ/RimL family protein N-acetyltransferase